MPNSLKRWEVIARSFSVLSRTESVTEPIVKAPPDHPFDIRNVHPALPAKVRDLFDDGYFAEATFEAFKYLDKTVEKHSTLSDSGSKLMMAAFDELNPRIKLTPLGTTSEKDEQKGYRFVFAGGAMAIRNPRGHEHSVVDDPDICLDHLGFVSMLLRRLEQAGYKCS
jgi:uncharacterized protein (TIGR02391 family)